MSRLIDDAVTDRLQDVSRDFDDEPGFVESRSLKRELLAELRGSHEEGKPIQPEDILQRWPTNQGADSDAASVLFQDFQLRRERGEEPSIDDYEGRFPQQKDSLAGLFRNHGMLRSMGASAKSTPQLALPAVGDELFGFRLRHELGRGAFAKVFLAEQSDLAGRLVVLKISSIEGNEPQTLAQLQHTHIVPIYSVHENTDAGLRAVCMPYFGGASLSRALQGLWTDTKMPMRGEQFVESLEVVSSPSPDAGMAMDQSSHDIMAADKGPLVLLRKLNYLQTAVWTVARLAEGLEHAHDRGVLHRDIKPSNILVGADGQPMLLDFNLAQNLHGDQAQATLGGTISYMAPEHLRALATRDPADVKLVDRRADIYSLGMVLYEMLTGQSPFDQSASYTPLPALIEAMALERGRTVPSLRAQRPDAPWSLESIIHKCLACDPKQRYQRAEHLAEDLRRYLQDLPLKYAPELSRVERVRKWLRRHPRVASSGSVATAAAVLIIAVIVSLMGVREHLAKTRDQLEIEQAQKRKHEYEVGKERALCLVNTKSNQIDQQLPATGSVDEHLRQGLTVCEETLALYGVLDRDDWQVHPSWQRLNAEERSTLAEDTRELLLLLAHARVKTSPGNQEMLHQALALLDRAEAIEGLKPSPALWLERANYFEQLGDVTKAKEAKEAADRIPPTTARDYYLLAASLTRKGNVNEATEVLSRALRLDPRHYWSWVQLGSLHQERGQYAEAAGEFGVCVVLWPEFAWGHFNLGCARYKLCERIEAIESYTAALERDPTFLLAYWNRGLAYQELEQFDRALADFDKAAELGRDDAFLHAYRGTALERLGRFQESEAAFRSACLRALAASKEVRLGIRWCYGFAVANRLPQEAREAFDDVLRQVPNHAHAIYGRAMLAAEENKLEEAVGFFNRIIPPTKELEGTIPVPPIVEDALRFRAIMYARLGKITPANNDINVCLRKHPKDGANLYAASCVYALLIKRFPEALTPKLSADAVNLLRQAFANGYGRDKAADDPDLLNIRNHPEFKQLLEEGPK